MLMKVIVIYNKLYIINRADEDGPAFGETSLSSFQVLCNLGEGQYGHTQLVSSVLCVLLISPAVYACFDKK